MKAQKYKLSTNFIFSIYFNYKPYNYTRTQHAIYEKKKSFLIHWIYSVYVKIPYTYWLKLIIDNVAIF